MITVQSMKNCKEKVRELLKEFPEYRDDDLRLIAAFYYSNYGKQMTFENMSAMEFLMNFSKGVYLAPDQITRVRRRLQEQDQELRGKKYTERHKLESEIRETIKEL